MKKIFLLLILLLGFAGIAGAATIEYVDAGYGVWDVYATYNSLSLPGNPYFAGQILVSSNGSYPFPVYCLSVQYEIEDTQEVTVKPLSTMADNFNPEVDDDSGAKVAWLLNTYALGVDSNIEGAALQLSIWEVLYDTDSVSYDLSNGEFMATVGDSNIMSLASTYLNSIVNNVSEAFWLDASNYSANGKYYGQDYGAPIPEPGSLLLLGSGIGALGLAIIRRRK